MPPKADFETHEKILIYLYENRKTEAHFDLLKQFNNVSRESIYEKAGDLERKGLITAQYPFLGVGYLNDRTGEVSYPNAEKEDYLKAKLTTDGIDYVRDLLRKNERDSIWIQISSAAKIIFGILAGLAALFKLIEFFG